MYTIDQAENWFIFRQLDPIKSVDQNWILGKIKIIIRVSLLFHVDVLCICPRPPPTLSLSCAKINLEISAVAADVGLDFLICDAGVRVQYYPQPNIRQRVF